MEIKDCKVGDVLVKPGVYHNRFVKVLAVSKNAVKLVDLHTESEEISTPYITMLKVTPSNETYGEPFVSKNVKTFNVYDSSRVYKDVMY